MGSLEGQKKQSGLPAGLIRADLLFPMWLCGQSAFLFSRKVLVIGFHTMAAAETRGKVETLSPVRGIRELRT